MIRIKNYQDAKEYIKSAETFGINPSLSQMGRIHRLLGDPPRNFGSLHVVGTNGKTSTARMIGSILKEAGLKVGVYTSPHIREFTERIEVGGQEISEDEFVAYLKLLLPLINEVNTTSGDNLTQFEILTALALKYFYDHQVDCTVLEAGMGGRWDATNVVFSRVVALTNISLEHTQILGDSISQIAWEKAGVIKKGSSVATMSRDRRVIKVLEAKTTETGSPLYIYGRDFRLKDVRESTDGGTIFSVQGIKHFFPHLLIQSKASFQVENATLSIVASELFLDSWEEIREEWVRTGLESFSIPGRLEMICSHPRVLVDGSHNPDGIQRLMEVITKGYSYSRLIIILALFKDKDASKMIKYLLPHVDVIFLSESGLPRSQDAEYLRTLVEKNHQLIASDKRIEIWVERDLARAVKKATAMAGEQDLICVAGSLSNIWIAKKTVQDLTEEVFS